MGLWEGVAGPGTSALRLAVSGERVQVGVTCTRRDVLLGDGAGVDDDLDPLQSGTSGRVACQQHIRTWQQREPILLVVSYLDAGHLVNGIHGRDDAVRCRVEPHRAPVDDDGASDQPPVLLRAENWQGIAGVDAADHRPIAVRDG